MKWRLKRYMLRGEAMVWLQGSSARRDGAPSSSRDRGRRAPTKQTFVRAIDNSYSRQENPRFDFMAHSSELETFP
jgi:hypothetical protein